MSFYIHNRHKEAVQHVYADVPLCHPGDLIPDDTQHQHTNGPQQIYVGIHSEDSVRKNSIFVKNNQVGIYRICKKCVELKSD
jgi:hypothetical protein